MTIASVFAATTMTMVVTLAQAADRIDSLEYEASGRYWQFTQAPAPDEPWPPFDVQAYVATLDYARGQVHAKYHRTQVQEPGRARPPAQATMDQFSKDGMAWNLLPAPSAIPTNLAERNAELWASPPGFERAAREHAAKRSKHGTGTRVTFSIGATRYSGELAANGDLLSVRSFLDSNVLGDTPIEFRYSDYRDFDGVRFPARIQRFVGGFPWYDLAVSRVRVNVATDFAVPPEIVANPAPSVSAVEVTELAPGIALFGGTTHNTVVVEQQAGLVVIEAPLNEERSTAILAKLAERYPGRKILAVVNTHAHFDHAGGLRTFVAAGVPVVTHERNAKYYARVWKAPHSLNPDRLAQSPRAPRFVTVSDRHVLADATNPVELHRIVGSGHNDAFLMAYLPSARLLVEADAWTPAAGGAPPPNPVNPLWRNLADNVERLKLDVSRVAPLHGTVRDYAELRSAVAAAGP
ncbi:MAG TPA: MBL fold metallo-hydrolase [Steroidobacteraceae bacterium]|nr:MBL fold metallo-hydrolase [Steroidobacteraceae bacterium]